MLTKEINKHVQDAMQGDIPAWEQLQKRFTGTVFATLLSRAPHAVALASIDATWARAQRNLKTLRRSADFPNWLIQNARAEADATMAKKPALADDPNAAGGLVTARKAVSRVVLMGPNVAEATLLRWVARLDGYIVAKWLGLPEAEARASLTQGTALLVKSFFGKALPADGAADAAALWTIRFEDKQPLLSDLARKMLPVRLAPTGFDDDSGQLVAEFGGAGTAPSIPEELVSAAVAPPAEEVDEGPKTSSLKPTSKTAPVEPETATKPKAKGGPRASGKVPSVTLPRPSSPRLTPVPAALNFEDKTEAMSVDDAPAALAAAKGAVKARPSVPAPSQSTIEVADNLGAVVSQDFEGSTRLLDRSTPKGQKDKAKVEARRKDKDKDKELERPEPARSNPLGQLFSDATAQSAKFAWTVASFAVLVTIALLAYIALVR